jgi:type I restriction enzyme M protein
MLTARHAAARVSHTSSLHAQFCPGPQGHACDRAGQGWPRHPAQEHIEGDGPTVFAHACKLGLEGIVSKRIRRNLVQRGYLKGIIGLPPNLFYGTGIPACIVVLDKEGANVRKGIFMIDASKGFMKDGNKNRLREQDIHKIVDIFSRQVGLARYSRLVAVAEISDRKNDYNLNLPRYIDSTEPEDVHGCGARARMRGQFTVFA